MADQGSIFLDEVGEISHEMQLRLLRVLEAKEILRVGGSRIRSMDVRVICASHRPLLDLVAEGTFRQDLYYRLSTLKIAVPPLRERLEDIPVLLGNVLRQYGKPPTAVSPAMLETMRRHHWPGNVRELLATMESYLVLLDGPGPDEALFAEVFRESAPAVRRDRPAGLSIEAGLSLREHLRRTRAALVRQAVARRGGDKEAAARDLDISHTTLWRVLREDGAA